MGIFSRGFQGDLYDTASRVNLNMVFLVLFSPLKISILAKMIKVKLFQCLEICFVQKISYYNFLLDSILAAVTVKRY